MSPRIKSRVKLNAKDIFYVDVLHSMLGEGSNIGISAGEIAMNFPCGNCIPVQYRKGSLTFALYELVRTVYATKITDDDSEVLDEVLNEVFADAKKLVVLKTNGAYHFRLR